ncbi:sensor histidine kinase [Rhodococcus rhodnii]|uniref:histidine kinase n=2 Tax=Rhodococcus rhodnii TaxID=38312 RepID=R7WIT7_9NOCA|nr:sensor histidine kinase [Rhodococcus rhodnii]EOM75123.1 sensor kinase [Rhodococcus rhodnii LMG 5362]TXG89392.1 sensor histidine kinase [Rhodococcus rhodnii]
MARPVRVGGGSGVAAVVLAALCWTIAVASLVVFVLARPVVSADQLFFVVDVVGCVVYGTVAAVVLARRVHPVPVIMGAGAIGIGVAGFGYAWSQLAAASPSLWAADVVYPLQNTAWIPGTLALFLVVPWLVRSGAIPVAAWWGVALGTAVTVWYFVFRTFTDLSPAVELMPVLVAGALTAAVTARRRATGRTEDRIGMGWLACGTALMTAAYLPLLLPATMPMWWVVTPLVHLAVQAFFPAAILVVVLRQRMWGIELAVDRATVVGALTVALIAIYCVVTTALAAVPPVSGTGAQLVTAAAVAVAVVPLRVRLERSVRRLVYGEGADPARAVRALGREFGRADTPGGLVEGLAAGVGAALRLAAVTVRTSDGEVVARWADPRWEVPGEWVSTPLRHGSREIGILDAAPPPGERLDERGRRTLDELGAVVTGGLVVARAHADVEEARERLVTARLDERAAIRRELHDGLGPSLAGIRLGLHAVGTLVTRDPDAAARTLAALQEQLDAQVDGVRTLARSMFPPVLDELGLGPALTELRRTHAASGFEIALSLDLPDDCAPSVATAAYGIAVEAVTNARRHSGADGCAVELRNSVCEGESVVELTVTDRGRGFLGTKGAGVGMRTMRERAAAVGGSVEVSAAQPHGTVVRAVLPLAPAAVPVADVVGAS